MKKLIAGVLALTLLVGSWGIAEPWKVNAATTETKEYLANDTEYCIWNSYTTAQEDGYVGGASYPSNPQSVSDMQSNGYLNKYLAPYCAWVVNAAEEGEYSFIPEYYVGGNFANPYSMVLSVNDTKYYTGKKITEASGVSNETFTLQLDKGINVVRMLTTACDGCGNSFWINVKGMKIDTRLSVEPKATLSLAPGKSSYINSWSVSDSGTSLVNVAPWNASGVSFDNFCQDNMTKVPYFSYTVDVPADGYYDMDFTTGMGSSDMVGKTGYFIVRVDNQNYKSRFYVANANDSKRNVSVYMTKGTHILTITSGYNEATSGFTSWCNAIALTIHGGVTKSVSQRNPTVNRYEAEDAYMHFYSVKKDNYSEGYSNGSYAGGANYSNPQSYDTLTTYLSQKASYIAFAVNAPSEGTYTVALRFKFGCGSGDAYNAYKDEHGTNPYVALLVNGNAVYEVEHPTQNGWISESKDVQIQLEKGLNIIYAMAPTAEVTESVSGAYVDFDYLDMKSGDLSVADVELYLPGDCTGDANVDSRDLVRMKKYTKNSSVKIERVSANLDQDVNYFVDDSDLSLMRKLLIEPEQMKELTILKPVYRRVEAEKYGIVNRYDEPDASKNTVGGIQLDSNLIQSYATMVRERYIEKTKLPYVAYMVNVSVAGVYEIRSRYSVKLKSESDIDNFYTVLSVNDEAFYKNNAAIEKERISDSEYSYLCTATQYVELKAGVNVIRVIAAVEETVSMLEWLNHDYIEVNTLVDPIGPQKTYLQSGESEYIKYYTVNSDSAIQCASWLGNCEPWDAKAAGLTYDSLDLKNIDLMPHFAYTIDVPATGYYDIDLHYNVGKTDGTKGYFVMFVDGTKKKIKFESSMASIVQNKANATVYLTAGTHTLAITSHLGLGDTDPNFDHSWCDFGALVVHGGITKSAVQIDPSTALVDALTTKHKLQFNADGNFTVLVLSDLHGEARLDYYPEAIAQIKYLVDKENPDLVLFDGDNTGYINTWDDNEGGKATLRKRITEVVGYIESKGIPWAHVYGNHDSEAESLIPRAEQQVIYESYEYCISEAGDESLFGVGNYVLPIYRSDSDKIAFNIWCLDSGDYLSEEDQQNLLPTVDPEIRSIFAWDYDYIKQNQMDWYVRTSEMLAAYNGEKIPGLMAFHIPLQEFHYAWEDRENWTYTGLKREEVGGSPINSGMFDTVLAQGDVKAIVCGHAHADDFMVDYKGVKLCMASALPNNAYFWGDNTPDDTSDDVTGGRVFKINQDDPWNFTTYISPTGGLSGN